MVKPTLLLHWNKTVVEQINFLALPCLVIGNWIYGIKQLDAISVSISFMFFSLEMWKKKYSLSKNVFNLNVTFFQDQLLFSRKKKTSVFLIHRKKISMFLAFCRERCSVLKWSMLSHVSANQTRASFCLFWIFVWNEVSRLDLFETISHVHQTAWRSFPT